MTAWTDKTVLITGGSAGLGLAIARHFSAKEARVTIVGRDTQRLDQAMHDLAGSKHPVAAVAADITQDDQVDAAINQTVDRCGGLDMLINCAGRSSRSPIEAATPEQFQALLEVNFLASVRCTHASLPFLLAAKGHVVFIGSLATKLAPRYLGAYPASKFPLAAYAQQLRLELGPKGLHTLLVCPGPIRRDDAGTRYNTGATPLPVSAQQPGGGARLKSIDPEDLAQRIAAACERRQPEIVMPAKVRLLCAIAQLWPSLGDSILLRTTRGRDQ